MALEGGARSVIYHLQDTASQIELVEYFEYDDTKSLVDKGESGPKDDLPERVRRRSVVRWWCTSNREPPRVRQRASID